MNPMSFLERLADFDQLIDRSGGAANAGSAIDALRTGVGGENLKGALRPEEYSQFDRYAQGVNFDEQNPGIGGLATKLLSMPVATAYEGAKLFPGVLNTAAKIPGLETLAVDETTSPPSIENLVALGAGMFRGLGRKVNRPRPR